MDAIFGGGDDDGYDRALAEQEHRKQLADQKARAKTMDRARAQAEAEAKERRRRQAFFSQSEDFQEDDDELNKETKLGSK